MKNRLWRCAVCGYVYEGDAPPDTCPVCDAPAREFEDITATDASAEESIRTWRCKVCGYVHKGPEPPDECPVCGVPATEFEEIQQQGDPAVSESGTGATRILIVGGGIAGLSAAEGARETAPEAEIIVLADETELPYYRLNLTRYLAGEIKDDALLLHPESWYTEQRIELRRGRQLERIHSGDKRIELVSGESMDYDKLIITTGAHPFIPPIEGSDLPHVYTLRTANDARNILSAVGKGTQVVCIGGGILGLETAGALARHDAAVTVLEAFDYLMPLQLNDAGSEVLAEYLYALGIDVITRAKTEKIESKTVELADGSVLPADMVVITVGVRANCGPLAAAGLPVNKGVLVDNYMRTSNPDILAAGDVCEHDGVMYGSWAAAQYQGRIAGMNAGGIPTEFGGIPRAHTLKVLGRNMFSIGEIASTDGSYTALDDLTDGNYRMFMLHDGVLIGALLIGDMKLMKPCRNAIENGMLIGNVSSVEKAAEVIVNQ